MKPQHILLACLVAFGSGAAHAERVLWTETATVRTKTIFADDGTLLYQQNWDKESRKPGGMPFDRRAEHQAWAKAAARSPAHYGTPPGPAHPLPRHGAPAGSPRAPGVGMPHPGAVEYYGTPGSAQEAWARQDAWLAGPFAAGDGRELYGAAPVATAPVAPPGPAAAPVDPRAAVRAPLPPAGALRRPEGFEAPDPEWTRLYRSAQAPLPERDAEGLPPPPVAPGGEFEATDQDPGLMPRAPHPDHPGETDMRFYNRVGGKVLMRPDNLVRVKVLDALTSARNKRGDTFRFVILEPIMYGLRTLVPAGSKGMGRVGRARSRGQFGRAGTLTLEFGSVDLPGATPARIYLAESVIAPDPKQTEAVALGAAGLLAFGPLGLAGGLAVKGADVIVEAGSVFHVEVAVDVPYMHTASGY